MIIVITPDSVETEETYNWDTLKLLPEGGEEEIEELAQVGVLFKSVLSLREKDIERARVFEKYTSRMRQRWPDKSEEEITEIAVYRMMGEGFSFEKYETGFEAGN
jgi:hypothetical protein